MSKNTSVKDTMSIVRQELELFNKKMLEDHGIHTSLGSDITYSEDGDFSFKVKGIVGVAEGVSMEEAEFAALAPRYGLQASDYMREVKVSSGKIMRLVGFNTRGRKYLYNAIDAGGEKYKIVGFEFV